MRVLGLDVATSPLGDPRAPRLHAGDRLAHPGHERRLVCGLLRAAGGPAAGRRHAARPRGALLRRPRRGALPQRRDVLDRHEAAHQAGAGAGARPGPAVPRRADQRDGPEGPRGDARSHPRPGPQQGRQPDPLVAPAARRRVHLRPRRRAQPGARRDAGPDRRAEGPARQRVRAAHQGRSGRVRRDAARRRASPRTTATRISCACSCPTSRAPGRCSRSPPARACRCGTCGPSVPTLEDVFAQAVGEE